MSEADTTRVEIEQAMAAARDAVQQQLGNGQLEQLAVDADTLVRFSPDLPWTREPTVRDELLARVESLGPWLQGPFLLGGDLVAGGAWRSDQRWRSLDKHVGDLSGQRVLDVGSNAGYDAFMFHTRGAAAVLACEPHEFLDQALFLEDIYESGVDFTRLGWQELEPDALGRFDLVHCHGLLYHEAHPVALLERLRTMVAPGGRLLLGSITLADPELSEYARFVPHAYCGDSTWWWVPGRLTVRWMLEAVGFEVTAEFDLHDGPPGEFATVNRYFAAVTADPAPGLTSTTASTQR